MIVRTCRIEWKPAIQLDKEPAIMVREPDAAMQPAPRDDQLMSKHRVLGFKPNLRLEWRGQDGQNETEQPDHSASLGDSITSSTRIRFSVHTAEKGRTSGRYAVLKRSPRHSSISLAWSRCSSADRKTGMSLSPPFPIWLQARSFVDQSGERMKRPPLFVGWLQEAGATIKRDLQMERPPFRGVVRGQSQGNGCRWRDPFASVRGTA
jgi:hypothetical protein